MAKLKLWIALLLPAVYISCSGIDDLIYDRHPELSEMQISASRVSPFDTVYASIEAKNPIDGILEYKWTVKNLGNGNSVNSAIDGPADLDSVRWIAPIAGGFYELKVTVSNTAKKSTAAKQIEVIVSDKPVVDLRKPVSGAYFTAGQSILIEARAEHVNGLSWVKAFIQDSLIGQSSQNTSGIYPFSALATNNMVGKTIVRIEAKTAFVEQAGADSVEIEIGGIIPGKNGHK